MILPDPSKFVPLIERAVANFVAVAALPVTEIPHVPEAPEPVFVGAYEL